MTDKCHICGLMTRNLRAHLKINHKTASTGFTKSPASGAATETSLASTPLVSPQLRLSYHQRMKERRDLVKERRERYSQRRGTSGGRPKITNNDSLNKSLLMLAEMNLFYIHHNFVFTTFDFLDVLSSKTICILETLGLLSRRYPCAS